MRFLTKFTLAVVTLTLSLHYYCQVNDCSVELQQACLYTSPTGWDQFLVEKNEFYRQSVLPVMVTVHDEYSKRVEPHILKLGKDVYKNVYVPMARSVSESYERLDSKRYTAWICKWFEGARRKFWFYYNVVIKPFLQKIVYRCRLDEFCSTVHSKLGPFLERIRFIWHYLRPYTIKARSSMTQGYTDLKNMYYESSHWMTNGIFQEKSTKEDSVTNSSGSDSEEDEEEEEEEVDDEDDIETSTMTSTVVVTVTMEDNAVASGDSNSGLEISEQDLLQDEFNAWSQLIDHKSSSVVKVFNKDVDKLCRKKIEQIEPAMKERTQELSKVAQGYFQNITKAIQDINCTSEIDPATGEVIYFDRSGTTQLANYITRPLVRAIFNETHSELERRTQEIEQELQKLVKEIESKVETLRDDIIEVYEEWGDVMITEWSKRLAYVDVVAVHFNDDEAGQDDISSDNWKRFLKLKKQVIKARDDLAQHPADVKALTKFVNKVEYILEVITKESGEYLYILRARANLAFQEREKQEYERSKSELAATGDTYRNLSSFNETTSEDKPDHVEEQQPKPIEESAPVAE